MDRIKICQLCFFFFVNFLEGTLLDSYLDLLHSVCSHRWQWKCLFIIAVCFSLSLCWTFVTYQFIFVNCLWPECSNSWCWNVFWRLKLHPSSYLGAVSCTPEFFFTRGHLKDASSYHSIQQQQQSNRWCFIFVIEKVDLYTTIKAVLCTRT